MSHSKSRAVVAARATEAEREAANRADWFSSMTNAKTVGASPAAAAMAASAEALASAVPARATSVGGRSRIAPGAVVRVTPASRISSPTTPGSACETTRMSSASNMRDHGQGPYRASVSRSISTTSKAGSGAGVTSQGRRTSKAPSRSRSRNAPAPENQTARRPADTKAATACSRYRRVAITECPHVPQAMCRQYRA